jgi:hypothetical protein
MAGVGRGRGINDTPESRRRGENTEGANYRRFDLAWNSENARTNPARIGWQDLRNLFYRLIFGQKTKTNWGLVQNWRFLGNIRVTVRTMSEP